MIQDLQCLKESKLHVSQNKMSDKFTRRDVAFYNQYGAEKETVPNEYPKIVDFEEAYGDVEHHNFSELCKNEDYLKIAFGNTITVKISKDEDGTLMREITEDVSKAASTDAVKVYCLKNKKKNENPNQVDEEDPFIKRIDCQMRNIMEDYKISDVEMADLYCKTNGDMSEVRRLLQGKKVVTWTRLEDLALLQPEDSEEYLVLLRTKGKKEIESRK